MTTLLSRMPSASEARGPSNGLFAVLKSGSCKLWKQEVRVRGKQRGTERVASLGLDRRIWPIRGRNKSHIVLFLSKSTLRVDLT